MPDPLLQLENLSVSFPTKSGPIHALQSISLDIPRGAALGLVGESGSGKSTVVLALLGLLSSAQIQGDMRFDGLDLRTHGPRLRGRRIAAVFQDPSAALNPALTIAAQVTEPFRVHARLSPRQARAAALEKLAEVGLPRPATLLDAYPHQLSGGMKQRVIIAAALAAEPDLLLLDEPTTALDVTVEAGILDLLAALRARTNLALLLVSHNLALVDRLCDRATILYAGRVVEHAPVADLLRAPRHPYARGLLAALPRLDDPRPLAPIPGALPDLRTPDPGCNFRPRCPFVASGCDSPQHLSPGPHRVRCHRAAAVADLPWPAPPSPPARSAPGGPLLEARNVSRRFGPVQAVDDVSLDIAQGEVLGLVGESGCGKSTLGWLLLRLHQSDAGTITFAGETIGPTPNRAFRQKAQIVLQNPDTALNPRQSVATILRRPLDHFRLPSSGPEIATLLDLVRLPAAYATRYPHQLSGGEKQRVAIARALASRPHFLICDEAVSALDVSVQAATLNLLADLRDRLGLALLFISHDIAVVAHLSNRIAVMYGGTIMELGPADAVLAPPYHPYTEALLSAVPRLGQPAARIRLTADPGTAPGGPGCRFAARCHRHLGPICAQPPPIQHVTDQHWIRCHIPPTTDPDKEAVDRAKTNLAQTDQKGTA